MSDIAEGYEGEELSQPRVQRVTGHMCQAEDIRDSGKFISIRALIGKAGGQCGEVCKECDHCQD